MKIEGMIGPHKTELESADFIKAVEGGRVFSICSQAGVTSQAGLSGTTPVLTLYNPLGSGVKGRLWYAGAIITVTSATAGAVFLAAGTDVQAATVTGTLTTAHRRTRLGSLLAHGNNLQPLLAATLPAAPVAISLLGAMPTGAITTQLSENVMGRWFEGGIEIMPGANVSIQTGVASGASGLFCEYIWEEIDL